jgi:hypothetical protein
LIGQNCHWVKFFVEQGELAFGPDGLDLATLQQSKTIPELDIPFYLIEQINQDNAVDYPTILMVDYFHKPNGEIIAVAQRYTNDAKILLHVTGYRLECIDSLDEDDDNDDLDPIEKRVALIEVNKDMLGIVTGLAAGAIGYWLYVR